MDQGLSRLAAPWSKALRFREEGSDTIAGVCAQEFDCLPRELASLTLHLILALVCQPLLVRFKATFPANYPECQACQHMLVCQLKLGFSQSCLGAPVGFL